MQHNSIQYTLIQYITIHSNTIQYNTIQYNTIQYNTIQCNSIQHNTTLWNTLLQHITKYNKIKTKQNNTTHYSKSFTHSSSELRVRVYLVYFSANCLRGVLLQIWPATKGRITTPPKSNKNKERSRSRIKCFVYYLS